MPVTRTALLERSSPVPDDLTVAIRDGHVELSSGGHLVTLEMAGPIRWEVAMTRYIRPALAALFFAAVACRNPPNAVSNIGATTGPEGGSRPFVIVAPSLPHTQNIAWTPAPPDPKAPTATSYRVTLDGVLVGTPTAPIQSVTFTTVGAHAITVVAVNDTDVSQPATLAVIVRQ